MHLTEDEALLVETVTKLMSDEVKPFARGWETTGIPNELWTTLGELGLPRSQPGAKGGAGLGLRDLGLVVGHSHKEIWVAWASRDTTKPWQSWPISISRPVTGQLQIDWSRRSTLNASRCDSLLVPEDEQVVLLTLQPRGLAQRFIAVLGHGELDPQNPMKPWVPTKIPKFLSPEGALLAVHGVGPGRSVEDAATTYALDREQFGRPIAQFQAIQ